MADSQCQGSIGPKQETWLLCLKHNQLGTCHSEAYFAEESDTAHPRVFIVQRHQIPHRQKLVLSRAEGAAPRNDRVRLLESEVNSAKDILA
jgi:hypothetical protein